MVEALLCAVRVESIGKHADDTKDKWRRRQKVRRVAIVSQAANDTREEV